MYNKIKFLDSIQTPSKLDNFVENYFFFGRTVKNWPYEKYKLGQAGLVKQKDQKHLRRISRIYALAYDILKALSYLTILIPCALLLRKIQFRKQLALKLKNSHPGKLKPKPKKPNLGTSHRSSKGSLPLQETTIFDLPKDVLTNHLFKSIDLHSLGKLAQTSKEFQKQSDEYRIHWMNHSQTKLVDMGFRSAEEAVNFFANSPKKQEVEYLDFCGLPIDNKQLDKLTKNCPNLTHLKMKNGLISGDALSSIKNTPNLIELNIEGCKKLEADALKHLENTQKLTSLNIEGCYQFEADALKHLANTQKLTSLNIAWCRQLEADALKHLANTQNLTSLNIKWCTQLEADALKHLKNPQNLTSLNIAYCNRLEADALKHLKNTQKLTSLNIRGCNQLEADALKHLKNTQKLTSLNIAYCNQLEADALKHLIHTQNLTSLNIKDCDQLEADALKHLKNTQNLTSLIIRGCDQLEADALKHLIHTQKLTSLNIAYCNRLEADALKHLIHTQKLTSLNIDECYQLEADALKHLIHTQKLTSLIIGRCSKLDTSKVPTSLTRVKIIRSI